MMESKHTIQHEDQDIILLREWLHKIDRNYQAYIKGASRALLYVQDNMEIKPDFDKIKIKEET